MFLFALFIDLVTDQLQPQEQIPKITEEQKQGIGTEDGFGIFVVPKVAKSIAKRRFIDGSVNVSRREGTPTPTTTT